MEGISQLFEVFARVLQSLKFWQIISEYERGVHLHKGHVKRILEPGIWFYWPFEIDTIWVDNIVPAPMKFTATLTTKDDVTVSITYAYDWEIVDIEKLVMGVEGREALSVQMVQRSLSRLVMRTEWADLKDPGLGAAVLRGARTQSAKSGIRLISGGVTELSKVKPIRLIGDIAPDLSSE